MLRHFFIVYNSLSKRAELYLEEIKFELNHISAKYHFFRTTSEENAGDLIRKNLDENHTDILIIGGDGTLFEVINALDNFSRPIGILPSGTGNDFYRMLKNTDAIKTAIFGVSQDIDIGICNEFKFLNGLGCAIEGESAKLFEEKRKLNRLDSNYSLAILKKIFSYKCKKIKLQIDGNKAIENELFLLTIANGRFFGSGYKLAPKAKLNDGLLDLVYVKKIPRLIALIIMGIVPRGWHIYLPFVHYKRVKSLDIESDNEFYFHADGEIKTSKRLCISLHHETCKIRF